jgi:hypothetical protein
VIKLYKMRGGTLHYREAWLDGAKVVEHWGAVGERGETKTHRRGEGDESAILERVLAGARGDGFVEWDEPTILLVEYAVDGKLAGPEELERRVAVEDRMNELLGWTGLGHCDGGSSGMGTMEVCCFVVDFAIAKRVIETDLRGTEYADYTRIYDEAAE